MRNIVKATDDWSKFAVEKEECPRCGIVFEVKGNKAVCPKCGTCLSCIG